MITDRYVNWRLEKNPDKYLSIRADLTSARMGITTHRYLCYSVLVSLVMGLLMGLFGYLASSLLFIPEVSLQIYNVYNVQIPLSDSPGLTKTGLGIAGFLLFFLTGLFLSYTIAMKFPKIQKNARATKINLTLHNVVSYMYAMRRGNAQLLDIFRSISENADIYGEVALEFRQVVRDADYFGYDLISAVRNLSITTPSTKFKDFLEDLLSVINSGGNISSYLESRVRLYHDEARFEQKQFLSFLQLVAEGYVTLFVAGPLFLIIIMVVMGLVGKSAVIQLTAITYALLPIGALIFILFVDLISLKDEKVERYYRIIELKEFSGVSVVKREGEEDYFRQLQKYDRTRNIIDFLKNPLEWFTTDPNRSFLVSVPLALIYALSIYLLTPQYPDPELTYSIIDDHLIIAILIILVPYGVLNELWRKKVRGIESGMPDFLDRLAGINRVGMTLAGAIGVLVRANLGIISYEIRRIKRDMDWGASIQDALVRFEKRIHTATIARTVTLITKASEMSGDIGEVLNIASSDARMNETLKRERTGEMFIYTMIIYLAFFVFVFVVAVLDANFLSVLETLNTGGTGGLGGASFTQASAMPIDTFRRLLYHTCIIQAFFSGLIAGQMGEGSIKAGVKHAAIMLIIGLIIFNIFI
ncbi:secretion system protein [Methanoplanus sp. FWC-SCC4]|uniref:Secretion system protein n=1 Tax=Methanochimaera problematica TaxID=2609417 RepID=A0AA97FDJ7_9EURY|nr:type II secretion system F family protein [Methanoplanus sp. FWC-SCC4]WOF16974.1 secretion system protein [Methanoplanus sp. FWC-SCC4]